MWHWHMATAASRWRLSTDLKLLVNKWGWRNCDDGGWMFRIWESSSNSLSYPQEASPLHISEIGSWDRNLLLKDSGLVTVIHSTPCAILSKFWARLVSLSKCLKHLFRFGGSMYWMVKQLKITNNFISTLVTHPWPLAIVWSCSPLFQVSCPSNAVSCRLKAV